MQPDVQALALTKAIRKSEGGDYGNTTGDAGTSTGAYQFQPDTWKSYAKEVLGDENAPLTEENQNAVAYTKIKGWKDSGMGPAEIAAKWNHGSEKGWENLVGDRIINGQKVHYDTPGYVKKTIDNFHQIYSEESKKYNPQGSNKPLTFADIPKTDTTTESQDPTAPGHVLSDLGKGDYLNALQSGVRNIGSALTFGGSEQLGKGISSPVAVAGEKVKGLFGGQDNSQYVAPMTDKEKSDVVTGGLKTAGSIAALAATPYAVSKGAGLMSKVFGPSKEALNILKTETGVTPEMFNTLSKAEKYNKFSEALKTAEPYQQLQLAKALDKLKPGQGILKTFMKKGFSGIKNIALASVLGQAAGGIVHKMTGE